MARKSYETPVVVFKINPGGEGDDPITGSAQTPLDPTTASFSAWKMEVQNANMDIDQSYAGYVDWMIKNGYADYIQDENS